MDLEQFWQIIEATQAATQEEQLAKFKSELQCISAGELVAFTNIFAQYKYAAYNWDLWVVVWLNKGGLCSDDSFSDFRNWLISRGHSTLEAVFANPDSLADMLDGIEYPEFESFGYVPGQVYRELTEAEFPDSGLRHPKEPSGGDWLRPELKDRTGSKLLNFCVVFQEMGEPEYTALKPRLPRTWARCMKLGYLDETGPKKVERTDDRPTIDEIIATVDPSLKEKDMMAYLNAVAKAVNKVYKKP